MPPCNSTGGMALGDEQERKERVAVIGASIMLLAVDLFFGVFV